MVYDPVARENAPAASRPGGPPGRIRGAGRGRQPVRIGTAERQITAVGSLRSNELVIIRPEIAGRIAEFNVQEGQPVTQGQPLVVLDDTRLPGRSSSRSQAALELSQSNYDRAIDLLNAQGRDHQGARRGDRASCAPTRPRSTSPRPGSTRRVIVAPFDGVVGLRKRQLGDFVDAGTEIVNLEQIDPLKVDFRVPSSSCRGRAGPDASTSAIDAFPARRSPARSTRSIRWSTRAAARIVVRARVPNAGPTPAAGAVRPGQLILDERQKRYSVPEQAHACRRATRAVRVQGRRRARQGSVSSQAGQARQPPQRRWSRSVEGLAPGDSRDRRPDQDPRRRAGAVQAERPTAGRSDATAVRGPASPPTSGERSGRVHEPARALIRRPVFATC